MCQSAKRIDRLAIQQYVKFHQFGLSEIMQMIVERGIAFGYAFQLIVEVNHNLAQWNIKNQFDTIARNKFLLDKLRLSKDNDDFFNNMNS